MSEMTTAHAGRKTALVTGASGGIGRAAALKFAEAGYDLVLCCGSRAKLLRETAAMAEEKGSRCFLFSGDLGDPAECGRLFREAFESGACSGPDVLVNNAGTSYLGLIQDMTLEEWDRLIRTDLSSVFYMIRLAVPRMLSLGHGKIINVSSVWGSSGASCEAAYSAAKGGVNALTRALAKELAPSRIQVNAVAPGTIDTEMNRWLSAEERAALEDEIPAGRFGTAEEAAQVIFMLAEGPEYLTGQIVTVSGGWEI
ncbi:MAG: SDR family oxidoreductase [Stomatobaculum sp.]|nr:SDR family oxidoreductase [Stomatobaculum sp.]